MASMLLMNFLLVVVSLMILQIARTALKTAIFPARRGKAGMTKEEHPFGYWAQTLFAAFLGLIFFLGGIAGIVITMAHQTTK